MIARTYPEGNTRWQTVVILGGPHDQQFFNITTDQDVLLLHDGPRPHRYFRLNSRAELHHESRINGMFGGGRR